MTLSRRSAFAALLLVLVAMLTPARAIENPCGYVKYCKFCGSECPKCETECKLPELNKRPPHCNMCKWCRLCPMCTGAKAVCAAGSSLFQYFADKFPHKDDPELQKPPSQEQLDEILRREKVEL